MSIARILFVSACLAALTLHGNDLDRKVDTKPQVTANACRERQCLNGLWRFRPLGAAEKVVDTAPPAGSGWGYFKVPGVWPQGEGSTNSFQPLLPEGGMKGAQDWHTAWYRRNIAIPASAAGKKVILEIELIQTRGAVYVDGRKAGEIVFPGGTLDLTPFIRPGEPQTLDIRLSAVPLAEDHFVAMDGNNITKVAASVKNKGITGDVFLHIVPEERVEDVHFITGVRDKAITFDCGLANLKGGGYSLEAEIIDRNGRPVKKFASPEFSASALKDGRFRFCAAWSDPELWDLDTPQNRYTGVLTLRQNGKPVDITLPEGFGFREFRIDGQNYTLNGTVIHLRAYHLPNYSANWMPDKASRESALEAFRRLRELGFNFSISRNYNFAEGEANYLRGTCEAADEIGYLHSISLPHPWQFNPPVRENSDAFARMAGYLIRKFQNHPSVILWVTNHNRGGAWGDQNPLRIGGEYKRADSGEEVEVKEKSRNDFLAAQERVAAIDPSRPVYSHASGSLGGQYSLNMYLNWAPMQERSDWLEDFNRNGKYPLSIVEWGLPHIASFSSYRWPKFIWAAKDVMTVWDAEYLAADYGDETARWTPEREELLDLLIRNGNQPTSWNPLSRLAGRLPGVIRLQADYYDQNLRDMRAWNIGMLLPWDDYAFWKSNPGDFKPVENPGRGNNLNVPGLVPDFFNWGDYVLSAHRDAFSLSPIGEVIKRWNQPLIAWIGGETVLTTREHVYLPGATVKKQLVILNDRRVPVECEYTVRLEGAGAPAVNGKVRIEPGKRALVPFEVRLPEAFRSGGCELEAEFRFKGEQIEEKTRHAFRLDVTEPAAPKAKETVALYDPKGLTAKLLDKLGVRYRKVGVDADFGKFKTVVIGREALTADGKLPDLDAVRGGLNVLVFEQPTRAMERLGFRINEHGLRRLFPRVPGHPALAGLSPDLFADWRGEATLLPPYLDYNQFFCPEWQWCGFKNTRVWRCRNRGTLANVLLEKPPVGDFTPILDGGFALQYAPLLEYREEKGRILFCQVEVTGRSESDPAAERLAANLLDYIRTAPPVSGKRFAVLAGAEFKATLGSLRLSGETADPAAADLIVAGPGAAAYPDLSKEVAGGKTLLAFGLSAAELKRLLPELPAEDCKNRPSLPARFDHPLLAGISDLDTYFQTRLDYAAVDGKELAAVPVGKGVCVTVGVTPGMLDYNALFRLRSSYRRRLFLVAQLLRNGGIASESPLLERFKSAPAANPWLDSFYVQQPIAGDDPYRYYHW